MKCFYHNDIDGRCAGAIVANFTDNYDKRDYYEVDYVMQLPLDKIQDGEQVWFIDYSFKENTLYVFDNLINRNCDIIWIDHHTSSINLQEQHKELKLIKGIRQDGISGAGLTYMYLHECSFDNIPYYVKLVSDYDCWLYKFEPDTTHFKLGIETVPYDALDCIWTNLESDDKTISNHTLHNAINKGKLIKQYIDQDNTYYRDHFAYESEIEGHKCLVVNRKSNSWIFGEKYKEYPIVMVWVFNGSKYTYSIFSSSKDIDCSKIAEKYGGGGHKGAAGFSSNELLFKQI